MLGQGHRHKGIPLTTHQTWTQNSGWDRTSWRSRGLGVLRTGKPLSLTEPLNLSFLLYEMGGMAWASNPKTSSSRRDPWSLTKPWKFVFLLSCNFKALLSEKEKSLDTPSIHNALLNYICLPVFIYYICQKIGKMGIKRMRWQTNINKFYDDCTLLPGKTWELLVSRGQFVMLRLTASSAWLAIISHIFFYISITSELRFALCPLWQNSPQPLPPPSWRWGLCHELPGQHCFYTK